MKAAPKYAIFENGNGPQAVVMASGVLELNIGYKAAPADQLTPDANIARERRVAWLPIRKRASGCAGGKSNSMD